jgi:hypothetical protein
MLIFNISHKNFNFTQIKLYMQLNKTLQKCLLSLAIILSITTSCKRTEIPAPDVTQPTNPVGGPVNDAAQVMASVSGIVLDESNAPVANAVVTSGTATTTTNANGMFIFQSISLSKENGSITAVKAGYFKGIRSFKTTEGKNHSVRLQLMARPLSGTVNAATGGTIISNGGATIVFPANAFVTSTGTAYTGTVNVYSRWIDPTAANLPFVIPGDLRGVSTTGVENILETYGMVGAELTDAAGNTLKIATGKTATVSFPIPASISAIAPATIVLWHFDDATARWKENGTATKTGNAYIAQVDKFSFWNVDVPSTNFINLDYTLVNATTNTPLVSTSTRIKRANGSYGYGITNNAGFVSGAVPKNEALILEVIAQGACGTVLYTQNIGPFTANTSLGNINVTIPVAQTITFTGTLVNCTGAAVNNGYVSIGGSGGFGGFAQTNATGNFTFSLPNCAGTSVSYNYQGTDNTTSQSGALLTGSATSGTVNLGSIAACGTTASADVYVAGEENGIAKVWKNGVATNLSVASDSAIAYSVFVSGTDVYVAGEKNRKAVVWKNGVVTVFSASTTNYGKANSVFVNGTDVYVVGSEYDYLTSNFEVAKVWKNGVSTNLTNGVFSADASSVFVSGTDVYVAGSEAYLVSTGNYRSNARLWKNGVSISLDISSNYESFASSVYISGTDVYVAGQTYMNGVSSSYPTYWKNNQRTFLSTTYPIGSSPYADCIFVSGTDVYITGYQGTMNGPAFYWKNGTAINLSTGGMNDETNSVYVKGNDVYVLGYTTNNGARVWKNNLPTNFFSNSSNIEAYSIFVK